MDVMDVSSHRKKSTHNSIQVDFVEGLQKHEQIIVDCTIEHVFHLLVAENCGDQKDAACTCGLGLQDLHRVYKKILAHDRNLLRRDRSDHFFEMGELTIESLRFR